ncbi:MAG: hypothetical protein D6B25_20535 [Desulfobulbaceae bacterium]|nr:MAG: hypothetical protein D6B25_20535 [Desulfobulbaceae bacterium]
MEQTVDFKSFGTDGCIAKGPFFVMNEHSLEQRMSGPQSPAKDLALPYPTQGMAFRPYQRENLSSPAIKITVDA